MKEDPRETANLVTREADRVGAMEKALSRYAAALPQPGDAGPARAVDEETMRALRSLGYVK